MVRDKKDKDKPFRLGDRIRSFSAAIRGLADLIRFEHNARIHLVVLVLVLICGFLFRISSPEWIAVIIVSAIVFMSECFNTAIESLSDLITTEKNESIRRAKDVAAAGVLISAVAAVFTGVIIFLPYVLRLFRI